MSVPILVPVARMMVLQRQQALQAVQQDYDTHVELLEQETATGQRLGHILDRTKGEAEVSGWVSGRVSGRVSGMVSGMVSGWEGRGSGFPLAAVPSVKSGEGQDRGG
jgi:hypothetical protein